MKCLSPYYELFPDIAMLISTFYNHEDFNQVYDYALKTKGFSDDFSARLLRLVSEEGTAELKAYVDSTRAIEGKAVQEGNPFAHLGNYLNSWEYKRDQRFKSQLEELYAAAPNLTSLRTEDVRSMLKKDEVAVEIVSASEDPTGRSVLRALILFPDKAQSERTDLVYADEVDQAIAEGNIYASDSPLSQVVRRLLPYISGKKVYCSSASSLDLINLSALPCPDGHRLRDECRFVSFIPRNPSAVPNGKPAAHPSRC